MRKLVWVLVLAVSFASCEQWECYEVRETNQTTGEVTFYEVCEQV